MPPALSEIGGHNEFELFASKYLEAIGYKIESLPGEGPDGGKDLIVSEQLTTIAGELITFRWLVSCKYHSRSIGVGNEMDIISRLQQHSCNGFMGFYSTNPSQGLLDKINDLQHTTVAQVHLFNRQILAGAEIIARINTDQRLYVVAEGYMPEYYAETILPKIASQLARGEV